MAAEPTIPDNKSTLVRNMAIAALVLAGFAMLGTGLVALTFSATRQIIADNQQAALLANLNALVAPTLYDNALTEDRIWITAQGLLGTEEPVPVYRAFKNGKPVAVLATPVAPDGYSGSIKLLVGVYADGILAGVRVLAHKETPGLGDAVEVTRSDWILTFSGKSLNNPKPQAWAVKKDGGAFDQFTGATITPRAVVKAVRQFLVYFQQHREQLLTNDPDAKQENPSE